jgi:O-antigen ligase
MSVVGFPLVAAMSELVPVSNTALSIVMRSIIATLSIIIIFSNFTSISPNNISFIKLSFFLFWTLYLIRMYADTFINSGSLSRDPQIYWMFAIGGCLLPATALMTTFNIRFSLEPYKIIVLITVFTLAVAIPTSTTNFTTDYGFTYDTGRAQLKALNPISFGHLGVTSFLLGYYYLRFQKWSPFSWVATFALIIGLTATFMSASRGPLLALITTVGICEFAKRGYGASLVLWFSVPLVMVSSIDLRFLDKEFGVRFFSRVEEFLGLSDAASRSRLVSFNGAWSQFLDNPFLGSGLEEKVTGFYPHNVVLEAFMAIGILGGVLVIFIIFFALINSFKLISSGSSYGWAAPLCMQYTVAAQFSGAIYSSTILWTLVGFLISICAPRSLKQLDSAITLSQDRHISQHQLNGWRD